MVANARIITIMADYITPKFDNQSLWSAYNAENQRLQKKKKWGNIWNSLAGAMDPNHVSSGMSARNDKRINSMSTSGMSGLLQQMKLMQSAEKEQIERELNSRLLTELPNLKSASDFNKWFQSQGPYVSPYYKDFFSTWAAGQKESRSAEDHQRGKYQAQAFRIADKLLPAIRQKAIAASKSVEAWDIFTEEALSFVDTNDNIPPHLRHLVKDRMMDVLSKRHAKRSGIIKEQQRFKKSETDANIAAQKTEARLLEKARASSLLREFRELPKEEQNDENRLELLGRPLETYEFSNPFFKVENVTNSLNASMGTGSELREILRENERVAKNAIEKLDEEAGIQLDNESKNNIKILHRDIVANPEDEDQLIAAFVNTEISKSVQAGETMESAEERISKGIDILHATIGGTKSERRAAEKHGKQIVADERKFDAWINDRMRTLQNITSEEAALKLVNEAPISSTNEGYEASKKALATALAESGIPTEIQDQVLKLHKTKNAHVVKDDTPDILKDTTDMARAIAPSGDAYRDVKNIEAVVRAINYDLSKTSPHFASMPYRAAPRMDLVYNQVWGALYSAFGQENWKSFENQVQARVNSLQEQITDKTKDEVEVSKEIADKFAEKNLGIPFDLILWKFYPEAWKKHHMKRQ